MEYGGKAQYHTAHSLRKSQQRISQTVSIIVQQDGTIHSLFIPVNCSTCFGWYLHPSSEAHITVPTVKKVKCSRYRPGVIQKMGRGIALLFHDRGTRRGWVVTVSTVSGINETVAATCRERSSSSNGLNNARYCRYNNMSSWWWAEIPPETCRAVYRYK